MPTPPDSPPRTVAWLGYGGLLPFIGLAALVWLDGAHARTWWQALLAYGAVILSFVGALHWGLAMALPALHDGRRRHAYVWSVVPSLMAWGALLVPAPGGVALLVAGFGLHLQQDRRLARVAGSAGLPGWYLPLRLRLTLVACACLLLAAWPALSTR